MKPKKTLLTGIKPTGTLHLGNYLSVIKPALEMADNYNTFFFIADLHALNQVKDPKKLRHDISEVILVWLACGLDPEKYIFYRQSSISEITELAIILSNVTSKGLLNRAHAYKAATDENLQNNNDIDKGINLGLFNYPLLMSADILMFNTHLVPVGKDQVQHIEIARNIAEAFNRTYGETITFPEAEVRKNLETVIGVDGRKMSKSYNNVIPIFGSKKEIKKSVMRIVTNSQAVEEPKDPDQCNVFALYKNFSNLEEQKALRLKYQAGGMGWGEAKTLLYEKITAYFAPYYEKYLSLKENPSYVDKVLEEGTKKAKSIAKENLTKIKKKIGII